MMLLAILLCLPGFASDETSWKYAESGVKAKLRGVSALDNGLILASGTSGTILRSEDAGAHWSQLTIPNAERLDFRDIQAIDSQTAIVLAAGTGEASRIYRTADAGQTWKLAFQHTHPQGFLDAIAFFDAKRVLALGDPIDGHFEILKTEDGGVSWRRISPKAAPQALVKEGCFAASGTCLIASGDGHAWFGTGGAEVTRVFRSADFGETWQVSTTPVVSGSPSKGIFGLGFRDARVGFAIGGDYKAIEKPGPLLARTDDGGASWKLVESGPKGFREAVRVVPETKGQTLFAVGPAGSEVSVDAGLTWEPVGERGFHAAAGFRRNGESWGIAVGDDGKAAIRRFPRLLPKQADRDSR